LSSTPSIGNEAVLLVVSAPSGTGKTSICREVMKMFPQIGFSISHTSRSPRPGEVNGNDYFFVTRQEFETMVAREEFVEWEENYGHLYGTSLAVLDALTADKKDVILDVDPRGARAIKEMCPEAVSVFILPPSLEALKERLRNRGHDDEETLGVRFGNAMAEMGEYVFYDYIIINDRLTEAIDLLRSIYLAEKSRVPRRRAEIKKFFD